MKYYTAMSLKNTQSKFVSNLELFIYIEGAVSAKGLIYSISLKTGDRHVHVST
jgi:hypothetical protein